MDICDKIIKYCASASSPIKEVLGEILKQYYINGNSFVDRIVVEYNKDLIVYDLDKVLKNLGYTVKDSFRFLDGDKKYLELKFKEYEID